MCHVHSGFLDFYFHFSTNRCPRSLVFSSFLCITNELKLKSKTECQFQTLRFRINYISSEIRRSALHCSMEFISDGEKTVEMMQSSVVNRTRIYWVAHTPNDHWLLCVVSSIVLWKIGGRAVGLHIPISLFASLISQKALWSLLFSPLRHYYWDEDNGRSCFILLLSNRAAAAAKAAIMFRLIGLFRFIFCFFFLSVHDICPQRMKRSRNSKS